VPLRAAGVCGFLALVTSTLGWVVGGLAQPGAYSSADDDVSDLGALTASSAWVYNQIGANLTGLLVMALALGVWRALSPDLLGRIGAGALFLVGLGVFSDGLLRLDCQGIDRGCVNESWHADAHKMESRFTAAAFFLAPLVLAFAFRRSRDWREAWFPSLLEIPAGIAAGVLFSVFGDGAAVRATTFVWFLWAAYLGVLLIRKAEGSRVRTAV
jgi:hypothetical protein